LTLLGAASYNAGMSPPTPEVLEIQPLSGPVDAELRVPGSKSYTNRALLVAAMAVGRSVLTGALFSDDTHYMAESLNRLGIEVSSDAEACRFEVQGAGGAVPVPEADLFVGNAGTAARFLVAFTALGRGRYCIDGAPRMRERPIGPLLEAIVALGGAARSVGETGCLPVVVEGGLQGGATRMAGSESSQYFSALLMVGPRTRRGVSLKVGGQLVSSPYIDLTAEVMAAFGARMSHHGYRRMDAPGEQAYHAREYAIPPDASSASYFLAAAAITGGRVRIPGLAAGASQGDLRLLDVLERMGCEVVRAEGGIEVKGPPQLRGVDVDLNSFSDMAQTMAAIAPFAAGRTTLRNIEHVRLQETDRLAAMAAELRRLGQEVEETRDGLRIQPRPLRPATIETYGDHRMAMAFSLVGLRQSGIRIADPGCVSKTFPDFFTRLQELRRPSCC
jgi:3-phosphoshikimate 1-carboxyvinyltransferase